MNSGIFVLVKNLGSKSIFLKKNVKYNRAKVNPIIPFAFLYLSYFSMRSF
jgi:hypothetical protein